MLDVINEARLIYICVGVSSSLIVFSFQVLLQEQKAQCFILLVLLSSSYILYIKFSFLYICWTFRGKEPVTTPALDRFRCVDIKKIDRLSSTILKHVLIILRSFENCLNCKAVLFHACHDFQIYLLESFNFSSYDMFVYEISNKVNL